MEEGCNERVYDWENHEANLAIWNQYGSELAGNFGTKPCGGPVVWGGKCDKHKVERRRLDAGRGRRKGDQDAGRP